MSERNSAANLEDGQPVEENAENLENQPEDALQEEMKEESGLEGDVFSYKEVSVMSEVTQESYPDGYIQTHGGTAVVEDLIDFEKLKDHTIRPLKI
jgi:hypothetical protein